MKNPSLTSFSIIVCCYNSAQRIEDTLASLAHLDYPAEQLEIILVNNASTDDTVRVATDCWHRLAAAVTFRVVDEPQQGLSHARRAGVLAARHPYLLFCDDDNRLREDYVAVAHTVLCAHPSIGALAGQGEPWFETGVMPNWFLTHATSFAVGIQALESGSMTSRRWLWGAACFYRRDVLLHAAQQGIDLLLTGRSGNEMMAGDDSELCRWFVLLGFDLWYDERLVFQHFIPEQRTNRVYLGRLLEGIKCSEQVLFAYDRWMNYKQETPRLGMLSVRFWFLVFKRWWLLNDDDRRVSEKIKNLKSTWANR